MKILLILFCSCVLFSFHEIGIEKRVENNEYEVKAAFIYNFTKFIEWEGENLKSSSSFKVCIFKNSPIESYLKEILKDKKINGKKTEISTVDNIENINDTHILFIPGNISAKEFKTCIAKSKLKNTLIVSEKAGRIEIGSCINFLVVANKVKFEVNLSSLKKNKLKASSQLLKLAERIEE